MKKKILSLALCLSLCATNLPVVNAQASDNSPKTNTLSKSSTKKKRYIIMFKDKPVSVSVKKYNKKAKALEKEAFTIQNKSIKKIESITHTKHKSQNTFLVNSCSIDATYEQIKKIEKMDNVEKCYEAHTYKSTMHDAINIGNVKDAWNDNNFPLNGEGTIISIIDSGVDYTHMDMLLDSSDTKTKFTADEMKNKIQTLGHGSYINQKVPYAYNYAEEKEAEPHDIHYHGTHVAGIAAANTKLGDSGVTGVAYNAQILSMQVFPDSGEYAFTDDIVDALEDSVKLGADVINMSLGTDNGFTNHDELEYKAVAAAYNAGCLLSIAASNAGLSSANSLFNYNNPFNLTDVATVGSPASNSESLSVAACTNPSEKENIPIKMTYFSSWGPTPELELKPEITAPGENIYSLIPNNDYDFADGTSMAAPYVSGVSALVKEAINKKNLKLSNSKLSDYIKYTLINTATPLMDYTYQNGENPYSVRQQGSGLVNAKAAIDNTVIATYNNDATIELGNIKEGTKSIPISIKLTNYGDSDKTYTLKNCPLYTDNYDPVTNKNSSYNGAYYIEKIDNSYVKFAAGNVTVKAGSTANIDATVILSDSVKSNHYIEGFIKLESTISLNLPLLGFYGDWDSLPIFDSPNGEPDCIMDKYDYGYSVYLANSDDEMLGSTIKDNDLLELSSRNLDLDKSAISLNENSNNNVAIPHMTKLRNADDVDVSVIDSNNNLVQNIGHYDDLRKNLFVSKGYAKPEPITSNYVDCASWNGKKFNEKNGQYENVKDGQYYFQIKARINKTAKYQTYKIPIYVDSVMPEADIKYSYDSTNRKSYIDVKASDNFALNPEIIINYTTSYDYSKSYHINYNNEFESLGNGYKRYAISSFDELKYLDVSVSDYAKNTYRKLLLGDKITENFNMQDDTDDEDRLGPLVNISAANDNLKNNYFLYAYASTFSYHAEIIDDTKNVDLLISLDDETGLNEENPITFRTEIHLPDDELSYKVEKVEHDVEKIDAKTYKVSLTPEEINSTYAQLSDPTIDRYIGELKVKDSNWNTTFVDVYLYKPGNDPTEKSWDFWSEQEYIESDIKPGYAVSNDMLNSDGTFTLSFDVIGLPISMAKVNGKIARIEYDRNYHYVNDPAKRIHVKTEVQLEEGSNYFTLELFSDFDNSSLVYTYSLGPVMYNGSGATFTIDTKTPLKNNIYQSSSDTFNFNLNIKSKFDAVSIALNGTTVSSFIDIVTAKNNTIIKPLSYKIKGDYVNYLNITINDLCGNTYTKTIKVQKVSLGENNSKNINKLRVKLASKKTYTGKKIKPVVSIKDGSYKLKKNVDFKVNYKNNKKIGKAKVTITGINNYTGKINKTFKIVPGKCKIKKVANSNKVTTIKAKKLKGGVKYEFFYSTKKKGKYKKLGTSKKPLLTTNKLESNKRYFIKVRAYKVVKKKKYVGKFSKAVKKNRVGGKIK